MLIKALVFMKDALGKLTNVVDVRSHQKHAQNMMLMFGANASLQAAILIFVDNR